MATEVCSIIGGYTGWLSDDADDGHKIMARLGSDRYVISGPDSRALEWGFQRDAAAHWLRHLVTRIAGRPPR
ncbi:hypothetical protein [Azospirillum soli]|uniref:hypothetical protein n=1 Tax=Azospirillum soli TaxID=1304799 RepID=UPI001AE43689|nr:hypothetical protein [Azospirillum soli]MBP2315514.1 hypothetical protein [Azospirillum soli]